MAHFSSYENPATKRVRVRLDREILIESKQEVNPGDDVSTSRHVDINQQDDGGTWSFDSWSN